MRISCATEAKFEFVLPVEDCLEKLHIPRSYVVPRAVLVALMPPLSIVSSNCLSKLAFVETASHGRNQTIDR